MKYKKELNIVMCLALFSFTFSKTWKMNEEYDNRKMSLFGKICALFLVCAFSIAFYVHIKTTNALSKCSKEAKAIVVEINKLRNSSDQMKLSFFCKSPKLLFLEENGF